MWLAITKVKVAFIEMAAHAFKSYSSSNKKKILNFYAEKKKNIQKADLPNVVFENSTFHVLKKFLDANKGLLASKFFQKIACNACKLES